MHLLVVGAGEVGRWFADVVCADGPVTGVTFADVDAAVATAAAERLGEGRAAAPERGARGLAVDDLAADATVDVVCIAVPLPAATDAIADHAPRADAAVVDVTGAMVDPLAAMRAAAPDRERASLHPLFAPGAAPGTVAVSTDAAGDTVAAISAALADAGNELVEVAPATHDEAMRTVQGRAHAAVLAFALAASGDDVPPALATPVYDRLLDLVERVTGGNPRVYADIQDAFGGAEDVADAATAIAAADGADADSEGAEGEEFAALYEQARAAVREGGGDEP